MKRWTVDQETCPECGGDDVKARAPARNTRFGSRQYLKCKDCAHEYNITIQYRTIVMRCDPKTEKQQKALKQNINAVKEMFEIAKREFQKHIYHLFKEQNYDISSRVYDRVARNAASTLVGNVVIPLDERNYQITNKNGYYFANVMLKSCNEHKRNEARMDIPVYRPDNKYYAPIEDGFNDSAILYNQSDEWYIALQVGFKKRYDKDRPNVYIGVDLNQRKHAASLLDNYGEYSENIFFDNKPVHDKLNELQKKISEVYRGRRTGSLSDEEKEQVDKLYDAMRGVIKKSHGDFLRMLTSVADRYWEQGYNVIFSIEDLKGINLSIKSYKAFNRWLNNHWCYQQFADLLDARQYPVLRVYPRGTSHKCHRCGEKITPYGSHKRLMKCKNCGYKDFNRDLNAARNIAIRGKNYQTKKEQ